MQLVISIRNPFIKYVLNTKEVLMDTQQMRELVRRMYVEVLERGDPAAMDRYVSENLNEHQPFPGSTGGRDSLRIFVKMMTTAFPDGKYDLLDMAVDGDKVWVYSSFHGTNSGEFMGMPATGKPVTAEGIDIMRVKGDVVVEHWGVFDQLGMMAQLGMANA